MEKRVKKIDLNNRCNNTKIINKINKLSQKFNLVWDKNQLKIQGDQK